MPPDHNTIVTGDTNNYYEAYAMSPPPNYQVLATTNLSVPFTTLSGLITANGPTTHYTNQLSNTTTYYRLQVFP